VRSQYPRLIKDSVCMFLRETYPVKADVFLLLTCINKYRQK
jgi:hypothetical protein